MNEPTTPATKPAIWFWIVNSVMLLWNLMGLAIFGLSLFMMNNREALVSAGMNEEQQDVILGTPTWVKIAFGVAVVFGVLGCIALLLRKKLAIPLLIISLLGVLAQNTFVFLLSDTAKVMGPGMAPLVIAIAIALIPLAMFFAKKGWLR